MQAIKALADMLPDSSEHKKTAGSNKGAPVVMGDSVRNVFF
jgi:hypothetical protein